MYVKVVLLLIALIAGSWALPKPEYDPDFFFNRGDKGARIVGGTPAAPGSHPHMAAMVTGTLIRLFGCGGSIVGRRSILTAAHCVDNVYNGNSLVSTLRVTVGTNSWNQGGISYSVARNVTHPNYLWMTLKNDIALLITNDNIVESALVRRIPLSFAYVPGGVRARVAGWGRIRTGGAMSTTLLEIFVPTIDGNVCVAAAAQASIDLNMRVPPVEPHIELCTLYGPNVGGCHGDSGGALVRVDNGQQIGIVSWGFSCALGAPDMFARISAFQSFLQRNIV